MRGRNFLSAGFTVENKRDVPSTISNAHSFVGEADFKQEDYIDNLIIGVKRAIRGSRSVRAYNREH